MYDHKYLFSAIISFPQSGRYTLQHTHTHTTLHSTYKYNCFVMRSESTVQYSLFTLRRRGRVTLNSDLAAIALLCKHLSRHGQISVSVLFFIICKLPNISKADVRRSVHRHKSTEIYFSRRCARAYKLHVKLTICTSTATTNSRQLFCKY